MAVLFSDIPDLEAYDDDQIDAFREVLTQLFADYPLDDNVNRSSGNSMTASYWRKEVIGTRQPEKMAYYACDTGVPNELVIAALKLIFTTTIPEEVT